jgi:ESCRT-I complex subunit VPS37
LQQRLYALRSETKDAFDEAKRLETRWKEVEKEQKEVYQRFNPQFFLLRLRHSVTAQDEASEALASAFVQQAAVRPTDGLLRVGQDVDEFIRDFKESRRTYHKRALWAEKWANGQVIWRDN